MTNKICFYLLVISLLCIVSCKKKAEDKTYYPPLGLPDYTYSDLRLNGADTILLHNADTTVKIPILVSYGIYRTAKVIVKVGKIANAMSVTPEHYQFTTNGRGDGKSDTVIFNFHIGINTIGTFPVTIDASADDSTTASKKFNIIIQ